MANENIIESPDLPDTAPAESDEETGCLVNENHWGKLIKLNIENGHSTSRVFNLKNETYRAGRLPSCELFISDNDISANKLILISKVHFKIERNVVGDKHYVYLEDLSSNGTFINNRRVEKNQRALLKNNTEISLASPSLKMYLYVDNSNSQDDGWLHNSMVHKFHILDSLGTGTYGDVRLVLNQITYEKFAMKKISKIKMSEKKIFNEVNILKRLEHPCITHLEDIYDTPEAVFITLEYISGGNLLNRIRKLNKIPETECKGIFYQLLMGVEYLHKEGITHRDLKPENILVQLVAGSKYSLIKITDFGLSKVVGDDGTHLKTMCGTIKYMAPEVLAPTKPYDNKVDIWSLGVILFVSLCGQHPFSNENNNKELIQQITKGSFRYSRHAWKNISLDAIHVIKKILVVDPLRRISLKELLNHKWLLDDEMRDQVNSLISDKSVEDLQPVLKKQKFFH